MRPYIEIYAISHHWVKYLAIPIAFASSLFMGDDRVRGVLLWLAGFLSGALIAYSNFPQ